MDARREVILSRIKALLSGATSAGARVFRSREIGLTKDMASAITVLYDGETSRGAGGALRVDMTVRLAIYARGDPWDQLASVVDVEAHQQLYRDAQLRDLLAGLVRISVTPESEEADRTAGVLSVRYLATFLTRIDDVSLLPV